jgi:uncharacterized Rossmann fold enzyme
MTSEKEDNFVRALERCCDLLKCRDHPQVAVTDWDLALINAIDRETKCKKYVKCYVINFHYNNGDKLPPVLIIRKFCFLDS